MRRFGRICTLVVVGLGLTAALARADEESIPLDQVPKAVTDTFKTRFPETTIKENEGGKTTYEVVIKRPDGKSAVLVFDKDGKFLEEE